MPPRIETAEGSDALREFVRLHDRVYAARAAHWPALEDFDLPFLMGESPFSEGRTIRCFVAREKGEIVARVAAVVDSRYQRHWNEPLGHLSLFEAMPGTRTAVREMMDEACLWLSAEGAVDARAGMGALETPFAIDEYERLPPTVVRQNPAYYHSLLKDAGFETEQGWVDYRIAVTPELVARWESALEGARRGGFEITPLSALPSEQALDDLTDVWADTFRAHWGFIPFSRPEMSSIVASFTPAGYLDASFLAYREGRCVGFLSNAPEISSLAVLARGRVLDDSEKLNFLGIGVRGEARGRGVNLALAAASYLELVRRGARYLSYTLVLDDNWPSRRTAKRLGAEVCANYVVYRRRFGR
jgi:GNAT superfamily N-acetyltransferase